MKLLHWFGHLFFRRLLVLMLLLCWATVLKAQELEPRLRALEPLLGTWESEFKMGDQVVTDVSHWEQALNGTAVRNLHSLGDGIYGGETLLFFDETRDAVIFYYFTTAGFHTQGTMTLDSEGLWVTLEDVVGNEDGITQVCSESRLEDGLLLISTQYFKAGSWTTPESRRYRRSERTVTFR
jgi:hypothetical protein